MKALFAACMLFAAPAAWAILGGIPTQDSASVLLILNEERAATGTLIGKRTVLCAGHSVFETEVDTIRVFQISEKGERTEFAVTAKRVHPLYREKTERAHDMALITLDQDAALPVHPVSFEPLERGREFRMSGFGATVFEGRPALKQYGGVNSLPASDSEEEKLEYLKSLAWERMGIARFYGRFDDKDSALPPGRYVSPASGDSGLGLIQDDAVRAVFSGTHGDIEVYKVAIASVPLWTEKNRAFLEEARKEFPYEVQP